MQELNSDYFENLAKKCLPISHTAAQKAYFEIEDPEELNEFDEALRSMVKETCMLLVSEGGELDDNGSENYTDTVEYQVYILRRKKTTNSISGIRAEAKSILVEVLKKIKVDFRTNVKSRFRISNTTYVKVGPMGDEGQWYGYTAILRFICPFASGLKGGIWSDN
ncbi:hypothetical protein D3C87_664180 [compost metagenome]